MPYKDPEDNNEWRRQDKKKDPEKWKKKQRKEYLGFIERCRKNPEVWQHKMELQRERRSVLENKIQYHQNIDINALRKRYNL